MSYYDDDYGYGYGWKKPESVGAKRAKSEKQIARLKKTNPNLQPVIIEGTKLARSWWGKAWNANLERYSDYSNRIGRGRTYVRNRTVLDLQIANGKIAALVQGSRSQPYKIAVHIDPLGEKAWKGIRKLCEGKLATLQDLLGGSFPEDMAELFTAKGTGLFPSPREIKFQCSCPDWAHMCKHVAAVLYGVGARLDADPSLFFTLRNADMNDLIKTAIERKTTGLLKKSASKSGRVIRDEDVSAMFGIEMEGTGKTGKRKAARKPPKAGKKGKSKSPGNAPS
jgi:uncharacterized Zn finger protein